MIAVEHLEKPMHLPSPLTYLRSLVTEPAFDRLTALGARLLNARVSMTVVMEDDIPSIKSYFVRGRSLENMKVDPRFLQAFYTRVMNSGQTLVLGNVTAFPGLSGDAGVVRACVGVPLIFDDEVRGCLCVMDYKVRRWTSEQLGVLSDLAAGLQTELELRTEIATRKELERRMRQWLCDLEIVNAELEAYGHTIAHNIKNPLNTIANFAGMLQLHHSHELSLEAHSSIDEILVGVQTMAEMTDQLLRLAKLHNASAEMSYVDVEPLVQRVLSRFGPFLHEQNIHIDVDPMLLPVTGHDAWIEEIFANLIANAINYRDRKKSECRIQIRSFAMGDTVVYEVQDNGVGISVENQKRLFTQFQRLNGNDGTKGHGLGLSIVYRLVRRMNGQVEILSTPGEGSAFRFLLPSV